MPESRSNAGPPVVVAHRYRVREVLGRGGMAVVYRVDDPLTGRDLALKRLLTSHTPDAHIARLFELEYHTLSQLAHPRIVEVYDYDSDADGPFYTMELLTGGDLRQRTPLAWQQTCRLLADVCSALALMHSRRWVHRDLTPRNVRCTTDGRAKLFDFGSMTQFGHVKRVVGTPPFVAPEALNGQALDGQTDLYALGATAYYALTGRNAFPARVLAELPDLWNTTPPAPSSLVPGIPRALDVLVMALLQYMPTARPASAAEVMERLSGIAGFEIQEALVVSQSYLSTPKLVGRDRELSAFTRRMPSLSSEHGASILVHGQAGSGRSRLLDACALEAKLSGALVLRVGARITGPRRWAGARVLLEQLLLQMPEQARQLMATHAASLALIMPDGLGPHAHAPLLDESPSTTSLAPGPAGRAELQAALRELLWDIAEQRPLVVVVDDLDRLDEPSAAFIALLSHGSVDHRVLVLASAETEAVQQDGQRAMQLFSSQAEEFWLRNLDATQNEALIVSLFGDVSSVRWLADRCFSVTRGHPARVMQVAHYLVQRGACTYTAGTWTLPSSLDSDLLGSALGEALDPSLHESALELAATMALGGLSEVSLDECLELSSDGTLRQLQADLQALAEAEIVTVARDDVRLSRAGWAPLLLAKFSPDQRGAMHLRLARFLERKPGSDFRRIQHLFHAGRVEQALDLMLANLRAERLNRIRDPASSFEHLQGLPKDWADTYHALIEASRTLRRPLHDRLLLQLELLAYATLSARFEGAALRDVAAQLRHDTGLDLVAELAGRVPEPELLTHALGAAQQRYDATPEHERGLPVAAALTTLAQLIIQAIGMAGRTFDLTLLESMPSLAPLASLSPALAVVQKNHECTVAVLSGRTELARAAYLEIACRISEPDGAGLESTHRFHMHAAALWAAGLVEAVLGRPSALERADAIEGNPLFAVSALRLRALHALALGDRARAEHYRVRTELLQIQNCPPQLFEGTHAMHATFGYAALGDIVRVKQCLVDVEAMAREHDGWKPVVHCGRGAYQMLRGDHGQALAEFERGLAMMSEGHPSWTFCSASLLWTHVQREEYIAAATRGHAFVAELVSAGRESSTYLLLVPLALAESRLGLHDDALNHIARAIELLSAEGGAGVRLGEAYEVRAYIAVQLSDRAAFLEYARACDVQYQLGTQNGLRARQLKLLDAARSARLIEPAHAPSESGVHTLSSEEARSTVSSLLESARGPAELYQCALALLARAVGAVSGILYLVKHEDVVGAAQFGGPTPSANLEEVAAKLVRGTLAEDDATQSGADSTEVSAPGSSASDAQFFPIVLTHQHDERTVVTGVAFMALNTRVVRRIPILLVQTLSKALFDAAAPE